MTTAQLINTNLPGWELDTVVRMNQLARTIVETTELLESMLSEFNERGGFEGIEADDGSPFVDVPDFLSRELNLGKEFHGFLIDDEDAE